MGVVLDVNVVGIDEQRTCSSSLNPLFHGIKLFSSDERFVMSLRKRGPSVRLLDQSSFLRAL